MRTLNLIACAVLLLGVAATTNAQPWTSSRADGHAPIGVMGDHTHGAGEFMLSYRLMLMDMGGLRDGTEGLDPTTVVDPDGSNFMVAPTNMQMQMHMLGLMYAPTSSLTLMAMVPFHSNTMDHITRMGGAFETGSSGLGDVSLTALYVLARPERQRIHAHLGVSLPTGSIDATDVTPMSAPDETQLPYPMQLGSGTVSILPGLTYLGQNDTWSWGGQVRGTVRVGTNSRDYRLGNTYALTAWMARAFGDDFSASVRATGTSWDNINGEDPAYAMAVANRVVPTVFPDLRGGTRVDLGLGINAAPFSGALSGLRLAGEMLYAVPAFQSLDGPQLETDVTVTLGAQYAF